MNLARPRSRGTAGPEGDAMTVPSEIFAENQRHDDPFVVRITAKQRAAIMALQDQLDLPSQSAVVRHAIRMLMELLEGRPLAPRDDELLTAAKALADAALQYIDFTEPL